MGALPVTIEEKRSLPDYLPARMVNEFAYCPRLFFYEWVEGLFEESSDTVEGAIQHRRVDEKATPLPEAADLPQSIHARSVTLTSERRRVIAKLDLVEVDGGIATPVDYKHGRPREGPNGLELWPSDRAQLAVQAMVLRENRYECDEGIVYYRKTGQPVRVAFDEELVAATEAATLSESTYECDSDAPAPGGHQARARILSKAAETCFN
jgi:CRISPR-associated protein Cas1